MAPRAAARLTWSASLLLAVLGPTPATAQAPPGAAAAAVPPWTSTCPGLAGSGGLVPQLAGIGPLTPGSANSLQLAAAAAQQPLMLVAGLAEIDAPFKGGTLCPEPLLLVPAATGATGAFTLPFVLPDAPAGATLHLQAWIDDGGAPHGWAASNGLKLVVQPADEPVAATLRYLGRQLSTPGEVDHYMGVEAVLEHHALVSTNLSLKLVDLDTLTVAGSSAVLDELTGLDCFATYTRPDGWVYVHLRQGGLAVLRLETQPPGLSLVTQLGEPGVFFEKMALAGDRLYVAAHAYGIRIYSLADPAAPQLVGSLEQGFADAFAIAVHGTQAFVADGDAGLKVVDIGDESAPSIVFGEDPMATLGAAEDVRVIGEHVYVAHGSAGVAVHPLADPATRTLYDTPTCAKHLAQAGPWLGVADIGGIEVYRIRSDGSLEHAARERALYRHSGYVASQLSLRVWHGIAGWGEDRFLAADWDSLDAYAVADPAVDDQPDLTASKQRLRFEPTGGSAVVTLSNHGAGVLHVSSIQPTKPTITLSATSATLQPGESLDLTVTYTGGQPGGGKVWIESDDPDESPLPIQVFGLTPQLDPGEPALSFALPKWTYDHQTKSFLQDNFDLELVDGQVVFFQTFGTW
jgi:hypothetical protein